MPALDYRAHTTTNSGRSANEFVFVRMTMKTNPIAPPALPDFLLYLLAYLLWLANIVVCLAAVLQLYSAVNVLWVALGRSRWTLGLANQLSLLVGGLVAFAYVMFVEGYYRQSVTHREKPSASGNVPAQEHTLVQGRISQWLARAGLDVLLRRFAITTAIPLGVYVASLAAVEAAWRILAHR
jgi:hypothetical protein